MKSNDSITLRQINKYDTDYIVEWRNKYFVRENYIFRGKFTRELHLNWMNEFVDKGIVLQDIIELNGNPVGSVFLKNIDMENEKAEFGIFIGEENCLGKGIGTEATRMFLDKVFCELSLHKIYLRVLAHNKRAISSYKKIGFLEEAYLKDEVKIEGIYHDIILMAMFKGDRS